MSQFQNDSATPVSGDKGDAQALRSSVESNRPIRQIAFGAFLFTSGIALGVFLASLPVRARVPLGISFRELLRLPGIGSLTLYACLLSSPLYVWLARRFPIHGRGWRRNFVLHFLITTALVLLTGVIFFQLMTAPMAVRPPLRDLGAFLLLRLLTESLPFWAMIALIHALEFRRRYRQREFEAARLQAQLTEARLEALTAQLHPHFLFNTLQGISTLMHRDVRAADAMLSRLSDLLRQTLQRGERQEVSLGEELEVLEHYVEISRERFKDRLVFETHIADGLRDALVPFFILQPLVENALQHGIARRAGVGLVRISAERQDAELHLYVTDDGPGLAQEERAFPREGIGLRNTRQRLRQLYGDGQSLELETPVGGGLRVKLTVPYRMAHAPEAQGVSS